jgi:hypothetical protein
VLLNDERCVTGLSITGDNQSVDLLFQRRCKVFVNVPRDVSSVIALAWDFRRIGYTGYKTWFRLKPPKPRK